MTVDNSLFMDDINQPLILIAAGARGGCIIKGGEKLPGSSHVSSNFDKDWRDKVVLFHLFILRTPALPITPVFD
jgi:hypothetical protein